MSDSTPIALSQLSLILKGCVSLYDQKLRHYLGQLKIESAKTEKIHRPKQTGHTERFIFHSIWFINESTIFKIFETRHQ